MLRWRSARRRARAPSSSAHPRSVRWCERIAHAADRRAPRRGLYRVHTDEPMNFYDLKTAQHSAEEAAESRLRDEMQIAGGQSCNITHSWTLEQAIVEDRELFVEATLNSVALGNP